MAPHLSITFDQPMVAVTSQEDAAKTLPVTLEPTPAGNWRWLGTKTLMFDPDPRFPMATTYTVTIPKGTTSALGGELEKDTSWTFQTPAPTVEWAYPQSGPWGLDPVIFVHFDQKVDAATVADGMKLTGGKTDVKLVAMPLAEAQEHERAKHWLTTAKDGRYVVMRPAQPLAPATKYRVVVPKGTPSAEGPRTTEADQVTSFHTYYPLEVDDLGCGWGNGGCNPGNSMSLSYNNGLKKDTLTLEDLEIEPPLERAQLTISGNSLQISGKTKARTTYKVTVPTELTDIYGQTIRKANTHSFAFGIEAKELRGPGKEMLVLDPAAPPVVSIYSRNQKKLRVRAWEVEPSDYAATSKWLREARYDGYRKGEPAGKRVYSGYRDVDDYKEDELIETSINLTEWLGDDKKGHVLLWVEPSDQPADRWNRTDIFVWAQVTDLGLTVFTEQEKMVAWVTDLATGKPRKNVSLAYLDQDIALPKTDAEGLATFPLMDSSSGPHALVATAGTDVSMLTDREGWWNEYGSWNRSPVSPTMQWFTFDDRRMYRPNERVNVKGWVRKLTRSPKGDVSAMDRWPETVSWTAYDAYNNELTKGETSVTSAGGFSLSFDLPDTPALGRGYVLLNASGAELSGSSSRHDFQIQEFRRPEFEVTAEADSRPWVLGEHARVTVHAGYYTGGALPDAPVSWTVTASPGSYSPPGHSDYSFGTWTPWWGHGFGGLGGFGGSGGSTNQESLQAATDSFGDHTLKIDFLSMKPPRPMQITAEARVSDVNRQNWAASHSFVLHPAALYVGLKPDRSFYEKGADIVLDSIVADIEGKVVAGREVTLKAERLEWKVTNGVWKEEPVDTKSCDKKSDDEAVSCTFTVDEGGRWTLSASVVDDEGRPSTSERTVWVSGGKQPPDRNVAMERVELIPDQENYSPGDVAKIFVQAPFAPAEGLVTLRRAGLLETRRITLTEATTTIEVPITDAHTPGLTLEVDFVGNKARTDDEGKPLEDRARRVAYASGTLPIKVPPVRRTLTVTAAPKQATLNPGGETELTVVVTDSDGKPVPNAEVAIMAVDEAVLALTGAGTPDPISMFYAAWGPGVNERHLRSMVVLADPTAVISQQELQDKAANAGLLGMLGAKGELQDNDAVNLWGAMEGEASGLEGLGTRGSGVGGGAGSGYGRGAGALSKAKESKDQMLKQEMSYGEAPPPPPPSPSPASSARRSRNAQSTAAVSVRTDLAALALWSPKATTDASGTATVALKLPDSLTRYRIMAVAADTTNRFGAGESSVTARKPLMIRPSPPRFLNVGDRFELPLVVQNQTDEPLPVDLVLRSLNATVLPTVSATNESTATTVGRTLIVPPNNRREIRIPIAAQLPGRARFQVLVTSGDANDAAEFDLPVWTPATAEAFATYGVLDGDATMVQPVQAPSDAWPVYGGLEINTSSTAVASLTDAVLYLTQYPYECTEQLSSRVLAVASLRNVLEAFEAEQLPSSDELDAAVDKDLARIVRRQSWNGGFSYWPTLPDEPWLSVHVTHAILRADAQGYKVDQSSKQRALNYITYIEQHIPHWYGERSRQAIIAYSIKVRHLAGDDDVDKAERLIGRAGGVTQLDIAPLGWILPTLHAGGRTATVDAIVRHLDNNATETAAGAQFNTSYTDDDWVILHSSRRADAVVIDALTEVRPNHDLIPKVVRSLLGHRTKGRWSTTQENSFVLVAMHNYFTTFEAQEPDFVARAWLGDDYAGEQVFAGRSTNTNQLDVPMGWLTDPGGPKNLVIDKKGEGRLYYRVGLRYAPKDLNLEPADHGFAVERTYEGVDSESDVTRDSDGTWHIKAGTRVRVRLTMVAPSRRTHVALVDSLPAGLEPVNPELKVSGSVPADPSNNSGNGRYWWWSRTWYEHQNLRDERVEAYTSVLYPGVHRYTYVANATTPGIFITPPARAEEMYHPETFGRTATHRVVVE